MSKENNLYNILNEAKICNSISAIANKLFLSQPYVSRTLNDAEKKYNVILIHRKDKPLRLTKAGEVVLNNLRKIIETQNELKYDLIPYQKNKDYQVKVAINQPWLESNADELLEYLIKSFPNITFSFNERTTNLAQNDLLNHEVDIFIGKLLTNKEIKSTYITPAKLYLVIPEGCSAYEKFNDPELHQHDLQKLEDCPYISLTDDSFFQAMVDNLFKNHEVNLWKRIKIENSIAAIKLAIKGYGFAISMQDMASTIANKENKKIKLIYIPDNLLQLSIGISRLNTCTPLINKISYAIISYFHTNPSFRI